MTEQQILSNQAIAVLRRDHRRMQLEIDALKVMVRSFTGELDDIPYFHFCWFTLDEDLEESDASADATIEEQWGFGLTHRDTSITVHNMPTHDSGVYHYYGDDGDWGMATYDDKEKKWRICDMECP